VNNDDRRRAVRVMHPLYAACLAHNRGITPQTWVRRYLPQGTTLGGMAVPPWKLAHFLLPYLDDPADSPPLTNERAPPELQEPDPRLIEEAAHRILVAAEALRDAWDSRDLVQGTRYLDELVGAVDELRRLENRPTRHDA
jgi:hypothetical protein